MDAISVSSIHSRDSPPKSSHPIFYKHVGTDIFPTPDFNQKATYRKARVLKHDPTQSSHLQDMHPIQSSHET